MRSAHQLRCGASEKPAGQGVLVTDRASEVFVRMSDCRSRYRGRLTQPIRKPVGIGYSIIKHYNLNNVYNIYHSDVANDNAIYDMIMLVNFTISVRIRDHQLWYSMPITYNTISNHPRLVGHCQKQKT